MKIGGEFRTIGENIIDMRVPKDAKSWVGTEEAKAKLEAAGFTNVNLTPAGSIRQATPAELAQEAEHKRQMLDTFRKTLTELPDNHPSMLYGDIVVGGKTVARVYQSGVSETEFTIHHKTDDPAGRIKEILEKTGGAFRPAATIPGFDEWVRTEHAKWVDANAASAEEFLKSLGETPELKAEIDAFREHAKKMFEPETDTAADIANEIMKRLSISLELTNEDRVAAS